VRSILSMEDHIFTIRSLTCAYLPNNPVLEIADLAIPAGQLVFVIGKSGIGKSTLIETLGLMNRTIAPEPDTSLRLNPPNEEAIELRESWSWSNERLSNFRRRHFSFIFQQTNLMPNFSVGENMAISLLIEGHNFAAAKRKVLSVMDKLSLANRIFDKKITEISGGQRQRLAFVRAITSDFTVLFGDEPTGNLDPHTAEKLMAVLKETVNQKHKTVILVSHDLNLAEQFADCIIPITPVSTGSGEMIGSILKAHILRRSGLGWVDSTGETRDSSLSFSNKLLSH
jgi:ABC-type lipoprotein export system ATPase subunit